MIKAEAKKYASLRSILIVWFIIFSIVPLALVSWYSLIKFQRAIESEQLQRLKANGREIDSIISDYHNQLLKNRRVFANSPQFTYNLSLSDLTGLKEISTEWMGNNIVSTLSIYNREGRRLIFAEKSASNFVSIQPADENSNLSELHLAHLNSKADLGLVNKALIGGFELILFSKVSSGSGKTIGYVEQKISLKEEFLNNIRKKLKTEILLIDDAKQVVASTLPVENKEFIASPDAIVELKSKNNSYVFLSYPIVWDTTGLNLAIGASKKESQSVINNVNAASLGVISLVILFLIVTILVCTSVLLRPIN